MKLLQDNASLKLRVEGHTDNQGNAAANQTLSDKRAQAVVAWLTGKGIAGSQLAAKGFGATKPVADNGTEDGRAKNRRVELGKCEETQPCCVSTIGICLRVTAWSRRRSARWLGNRLLACLAEINGPGMRIVL